MRAGRHGQVGNVAFVHLGGDPVPVSMSDLRQDMGGDRHHAQLDGVLDDDAVDASLGQGGDRDQPDDPACRPIAWTSLRAPAAICQPAAMRISALRDAVEHPGQYGRRIDVGLAITLLVE